MDDKDVDPSARFREVPEFLTEGLRFAAGRMCQQLRLLLHDVPTSGVHGAYRKLQAHGYPKIGKQLRSLFQLEEALAIGRNNASFRAATPPEQLQRAHTPGSSRPGTRQSMNMLHKYKKTAASLAQALLVEKKARDIIIETKPRNAERDRELATAKVSCWPAPRNVGFFLHTIDEAIEASCRRASRSVDWVTWHQQLLQHQETRATHANGDVKTLKNVLSDLEAEKRESFAATDATEALLMGEIRYARKSIELEEMFENSLQARWEQDVGGRVAHRCADKLGEIEVLEMELARLTESHQDERLRMKRVIAKAQRRADETREEWETKAKRVNAKLIEAQNDIIKMAATRKRLEGNIKRELHRLDLEAALSREVTEAEEMWRMACEDVAVPESSEDVFTQQDSRTPGVDDGAVGSQDKVRIKSKNKRKK